MYKVFIVSRCKKNTLKKTRTIIDGYALRVSDKTWKCNITQEGLHSLIRKLKETARKNTAIAIYYLKNGNLDLHIIIGNRKEFGSDGACPIFTTNTRHATFTNGIDCKNMPYYKKITEFIGYSHDLGKVSGYFQDLLNDKKERKLDPLRHELFSILIIAAKNKSELTHFLEKIKTKNLNLNDLKLEKNLEWIIRVIVSHHRVAGVDGNSIDFSEHLREDTEFDISKLLQYYDTKEFQSILVKSKDLQKEIESFNIVLDIEHFYQFRNALMLSDHYISEKHTGVAVANTNNHLLAKPIFAGAEKLSTHLYSVGKMAAFILEDQIKLKYRLPSLGKEEIISITKTARGKFVWQNKAITSLKKTCKDNNNCNFVVLGASTGSGKTMMGLKIANELSDESGLRLNVALGLRTLTSQASSDYKKALDLPSDMIATLIGSMESENLKNKMKTNIYKETISVLKEDTIEIEDGLISENLTSYVKTQCQSSAKKRLLSTPIVVSTIDYLIKAADWRRSKHLVGQLRLMSSDLIIDEIDMYDKDDFIHILKLIYMTGVFGRNIIISSATILPAITQYAYGLYIEGLKLFNRYNDSKKGINLHYLSDNLNKGISFDTNDFENSYNFFTSSLQENAKELKKIHNNSSKHKIRIVDNLDSTNFAEYIKELHEQNKNRDENNKVNYSIGLIRIEKIRNCYDVLKDLNLTHYFESHNIKVNFVFYHARLPLHLRVWTENKLDEALYRKKDKDPYLSSYFHHNNLNNKKETQQDCITIVIASPVEEVGKDHDFDWAIIEPSSSRSIIQSIGRVNRHRNIIVKKHNVYVLNNNFNHIEKRKTVYRTTTKTEGINKIYSIIEDNPTASSIIDPIKESLPFFENKELITYLKSNVDLFFKTKSINLTTTKLIDKNWRNGVKQKEYIYSKELNKYLTVVDNNLIDENIPFTDTDFDNKNCVISDRNLDEIINSLYLIETNIDVNDFDKKYGKVSCAEFKNNKNSNFNKILGII